MARSSTATSAGIGKCWGGIEQWVTCWSRWGPSCHCFGRTSGSRRTEDCLAFTSQLWGGCMSCFDSFIRCYGLPEEGGRGARPLPSGK
ncbi:unnamed protein product [Ectocarpus sp. 13 AM-2016]